MDGLEKIANRVATVITIFGFLLAVDLNAFNIIAPQSFPVSNTSIKFIIFVILDSAFAYFFTYISLLFFQNRDGIGFPIVGISMIILALVSSWQTVSLLFWMFVPDGGNARVGYSLIPVALNVLIILLHAQEAFKDKDSKEGQVVYMFGFPGLFIVAYIFQASVY